MSRTSWVRLLAALVLTTTIAAACSAAPRPGSDQASVEASGDDRPSNPADGGDDLAPDAGSDLGGDTVDGSGTVAEGSGGATPDTGSADRGGSGGAPAPGQQGGGGTGGPGGSGYVSTLFAGSDDTRGISDDEIVMCAHAALTYGAAFNTSKEDLNVYWNSINKQGGVFGRKVRVEYENDNYSPDTAVQAATACKDNHDPFMLIGGIGFDQIPAVRSWAQNNKMLYVHHTATENGSQDKTYSFTALPTTETMGKAFAELARARFSHKKIGIIKRGSENWEPGIVGFKKLAKQYGLEIVLEREVQVNKGAYLQDIVDLQNAGADLVFVWLNALESTEFIKQAAGQQYRPQYMVFPFNLTSQTLGNDALDPPIVGVAMFNVYSFGDRSGEFAKYADDLKLFEQQYAAERPGVDLGGVGGDLLFLNWSAQKALHELLIVCGPQCTRNRFVELLHDYKGVPTSSACELDFTRADSNNGRRGGFAVSFLQTYRAPDGNVNYRNTDTCVQFAS